VTNSESAERLEATFRRWLLGHRDRAAKRLGLTVIGEPQFGVGLRSVSGLCRTSGGEPRWLRVGAELASDVRAFPLVWTGIAESNAVRGVPKPYVLASTDYTDEFNGLQFCVRADAMTVIDGQPISSSRVLRHPVDLPDQWWRDLRSALDTLRATPTDRVKKNPAADARIRKVLGFDLVIPQQETVHGDLHWANLYQPLAILDWELWGRGPAGADAAKVYCLSLLMPEVAHKVYEVFEDQLASDTGRLTLLHVAAKLLQPAKQEFPDLIDPLHDLIRTLL